ncbi:MAG TPA: hypothetical protein VIV60_32550 [Polyangiaceae bacterium]
MKYTQKVAIFTAPACLLSAMTWGNAYAAEPNAEPANVDPAATAVAPTEPAAAPLNPSQTTAPAGKATVSSTAAPASPSFTEPPVREDSGDARPRNADEPETLFNSKAKIGGFGGLGVMYTRFGGKDATQLCLEGSLMFDHKLSLGLAGCGVARTLRTTTLDASADPDFRTSFGYGGALIRYHFFSHRYLNVALSTLVGAGAIASDDFDSDGHHREHRDVDPDFVFVVEPQLSAYLTLTRWMRVGATGGYRFVSGVETKGLTESKIAAPVVGAQMQLGWF